MEDRVKKLEQKIESLENVINSLRAFTTIPKDIDSAFRERFSDIIGLSVSAKDLNSEDQSVNEAGVATYSVLGDPDGFLEIVIDNTTYYLPYY